MRTNISKVKTILADEFPEEKEISSVEDALRIHDRLINCAEALFLEWGIGTRPHYRGEQNFGWDILSGIFRPPFYNGFSNERGKIIEEKAIYIFEDEVKGNFGESALIFSNTNHKFGRQWDLLMQAQHAGIRTSLIDWSDSILTTTFFATEFDESWKEQDGQLWAFLVPDDWILGEWEIQDSSSFYDFNPFKLESGFMINPSILIDDIDNRIYEFRTFRQGGRFFVAPNKFSNLGMNNMPLIEDLLLKFRIPAKSKGSLQKELAERGITRNKYFLEETKVAGDLIRLINSKLEDLRF